jgi:hypothetical protein
MVSKVCGKYVPPDQGATGGSSALVLGVERFADLGVVLGAAESAGGAVPAEENPATPTECEV